MVDIEGVVFSEEALYGCKVTTVDVLSEQAAKDLGKKVGTYITICVDPPLDKLGEVLPVGECLAEVLDRILRPYYHGKLCICGVGNDQIPADALGPEVARSLPLKQLSELGKAGSFREVCSFVPGTMATNNIATEDIAGGVTRAIGADCALLVDSCVTQDVSRLFRTIQLSTNGGLSSYMSGRKADWSALNIPVISLVVPTAISLFSLLTGSEAREVQDETLTSTGVKDVVEAAGNIIAYAILRTCWPSLSKAECFIYSKINRDSIPFSSVLGEAFEDTEETETPPAR